MKKIKLFTILFFTSFIINSCNVNFESLGALDETLDEEYRVPVRFIIEGDFPDAPYVYEKQFFSGNNITVDDFPEYGTSGFYIENYKMVDTWELVDSKFSKNVVYFNDMKNIKTVKVPAQDEGILELKVKVKNTNIDKYKLIFKTYSGKEIFSVVLFQVPGKNLVLSQDFISQMNTTLSEINTSIDESLLQDELNAIEFIDDYKQCTIKCISEHDFCTITFIRVSDDYTWTQSPYHNQTTVFCSFYTDYSIGKTVLIKKVPYGYVITDDDLQYSYPPNEIQSTGNKFLGYSLEPTSTILLGVSDSVPTVLSPGDVITQDNTYYSVLQRTY